MKDKTKKNSGEVFPVELKLNGDIVCKGKAFVFFRILEEYKKGNYKPVSFVVYL